MYFSDGISAREERSNATKTKPKASQHKYDIMVRLYYCSLKRHKLGKITTSVEITYHVDLLQWQSF